MRYENAAPRSCEERAGTVRDSVTWQHPFRNVQISMPHRAMGMLANEALRHLKAKAPSEMGGILWGGRPLDAPNPATLIAEVQLIPAEGSLYNATPQDAVRLARALTGPRKPAGMVPVGYFRSHIRDGLALSAEDQRFIADNLRDPNAVFLLIRPFEIGICMGGFFFWQDGRLQTDTSDLEVPFLATNDDGSEDPPRAEVHSRPVPVAHIEPRMEPPVPAAIIPAPPPRSQPAPAPHDEIAKPEPVATPPQEPQGRRVSPLAVIGIAALALLIVSGISAGVSLLRSRSLTSPKAGIGLRVSRLDSGQLDLSWNREAPELTKAHAAKLDISDGVLRQELDIDSAQLHLGRLIYFPQGSDVQFRLVVLLDGQRSVTESVRVIAPGIRLPGSVSTPNSGVPASDRPVQRPGNSAPQRRFRSPELVAGRTQFPVPQNGHVIPRPEIRLTAQNDPLPPAGLGVLPKPPESSAAPVPVPERSSTAVQSAPVSAFVPPHPVREVMPDLRQLGAWVISAPTEIAVSVRIDETGTVSEATPVATAKTPNRLLASAALNAARQWKFTPGMMRGKPVATDHTIVFEFRPQAH